MSVNWSLPIVAYSKDKSNKYDAFFVMKLQPEEYYEDYESTKYLVKINGKYGEIVELFYENGESSEEADLVIENFPIYVSLERLGEDMNKKTFNYVDERVGVYKLQLDHLEAKFRMMEIQFSEVLHQFNQVINAKNNPH